MKIVTICGSMKFETEMKRIAFLLETKYDMNVQNWKRSFMR